jgi:hypothetical protein
LLRTTAALVVTKLNSMHALPGTLRAGSAWGTGAERVSAAEQCAALLFAQALKPLAKALGFYGDAVVSAAALAAARAEHGGLRDVFERALGSER